MRVAVIGTGYVGLVTAACLAERGHTVTCVDRDADKVARIARGECPIHEPGLAELLERHRGSRLQASTDLAAAVRGAELSLITVGTPLGPGGVDLQFVAAASREIGAALRGASAYHVVVVKSTVVPGTTESLVRPLLEQASGRRAGEHFGLGMNPEFLREGAAVQDFMHPDRIVVGGIDARSCDVLAALYASFGGVPLVRTNPRTAEMIKYASNALFATFISYSNEVANLCAALGGIDSAEVERGVQLDRRLSPVLDDGRRLRPGALSYLAAGCGFGGSCFPKDLAALAAHGRAHGVPMRIVEAVLQVNTAQADAVLALLRKRLPSLSGEAVAVLGIAFKPDTDDIRESPALRVIEQLAAEGARVRAYDPAAMEPARRHFASRVPLVFCASEAEAIAGAKAVLVLTSWPQFREVPGLIRGRNPDAVLVDGRRMFAPDSVARYEGIGLG
jgi:UDPglucose 6-dehydrogenase